MFLTKYKFLLSDSKRVVGNNYKQNCMVIDKFLVGSKAGIKYGIHTALNTLFDKELVTELKTYNNGKDKLGIIFASGASEWAGSSLLASNKNEPLYNYNISFMTLINIVAGKFANKIGWTDYISSDASACISSMKAMFEAKLLLDSGHLDKVLVIGIDDQINEATLEVFYSTGASLKLKEEEEGKKPSAFDNVNGKFHIGNGIGYVMLEKECDDYICTIDDITVNGEVNNNPLGMTTTGEGYDKTISTLLKNTSIAKEDITFIKTHGSGTEVNNLAEGTAIRKNFGDIFIATSYKPEIGHTMGASSVVEMCLALQDASNGRIRAIKNRTSNDNFISEDITDIKVKNILHLASGMGNVYAGCITKLK